MEQRGVAHPSLQLSLRPDTLCFPCGVFTYCFLPSAYCHFPRWYGPTHLFTNGMTHLWLPPFSQSMWYNPPVFLTATVFFPRKSSRRGAWYSPDFQFPFPYYHLDAEQPNLHVPSDLLPSLYGPVQALTLPPTGYTPAPFSSQTVVDRALGCAQTPHKPAPSFAVDGGPHGR